MLDALQQTFGRSHLVVLHLPIGLLIVAGIIELFRLFKPRPIPEAGQGDETLFRLLRYTPTPSAYACVFFATVFGAYTAVSGWVYAGNEFTAGGDLEWHRWLGTIAAGLAGLTLVTGLVATLARVPIATRVYRVALLLAVVSVGWAGHLGGELVHGEGYVTEPLTKRFSSPAPAPSTTTPPATTPADTTSPPPDTPTTSETPPPVNDNAASPAIVPVAFTFERDIAPIFNDACVRCHREGRVRGDLKLDSQAEAMHVIVPGDADASELVKRIRLPESDEDSMPKDRPNLPAEQIDTIVAWINAMPKPVVEPLPPAPEVRHVPGPTIQTPPTALAVQAADQPITLSKEQQLARDEAIARLRARLVSASERSADSGTVEVRVFEGRSDFTDDDLALLDGLQPCLTMLDLTGTAVSDKGLALLAASFPRLRVLRLGQTSITDAGLRALGPLRELALLDVHSTKATTSGLEAVASKPSLLVINAWNCGATPEQLAELAATHPNVEIRTGD